MFDIGWTEILVIAAVAIIVVGPKELPQMLRTFGRVMGQVRRTAGEFRRQFDDALRDAERQADLMETRKELQSITRIDPLADLKKSVEAGSTPGRDTKPVAAPAPPAVPPPEPVKPRPVTGESDAA